MGPGGGRARRCECGGRRGSGREGERRGARGGVGGVRWRALGAVRPGGAPPEDGREGRMWRGLRRVGGGGGAGGGGCGWGDGGCDRGVAWGRASRGPGAWGGVRWR